MIATDFQPFSIVEDEGFKLVLNVMDQRYKVPSRIDADIYNIGIGVHTTIYSDIVHVSFSGQYGD